MRFAFGNIWWARNVPETAKCTYYAPSFHRIYSTQYMYTQIHVRQSLSKLP